MLKSIAVWEKLEFKAKIKLDKIAVFRGNTVFINTESLVIRDVFSKNHPNKHTVNKSNVKKTP